MLEELLKGLIVGICASVPLGPMSDTFFAAIALLSLSFVQRILSDYQDIVMIVGGLIVGAFGVKLFMTNPIKQIKRIKSGDKRYWQDFFSTLLMTVSNPGAFFLMLGLFAFIGIDGGDGNGAYNIIASALAGVFIGATMWWYALSTSINMFRNKLRLRQLMMINRVAGVAIMVLGVISIFEGLYPPAISDIRWLWRNAGIRRRLPGPGVMDGPLPAPDVLNCL